MQDEGEPLGGSQGLQDHQQRDAHGIGDEDLVLRIDGCEPRDDRVGQPDVPVLVLQRILAPRGARAQHVQAHPADHGGQPAAQVVHGGDVRAAQLQPGLLHGVLGLADRAQHPVGHGPQMGAVLLEAPGQRVLLAHLSRPRVVDRRCTHGR